MDIKTVNEILQLNAEANKFTTHGRYELSLLADDTIDVQYIGSSRGFYAELTLAARGMLAFYSLYFKAFRNYKLNINCSKAWVDFTPPGIPDLYPILYKQDLSIEFLKHSTFDNALKDTNASHRVYKDLNLEQLNNLYKIHYSTSDEQLSYYNYLTTKYQIDYDNTIGVCYRGTDKNTELTLADPREYLRIAETILSTNSKSRVLIQTDQQQVIDLFKNTFKDRCFYLEEMPATLGAKAIHKIIKNEEKVGFVKTLDVCTRILANCRYLINHTGNVAFVIQVHRNNPTNVWQFDRTASLIEPSLKDA